ncbi:MAG: outer membrane protein transport protein [Polyangiaceae bacterium]
MLYSARHMGMGGTAIGYVNDPSALFHNPAGLAQIEHGEVLGDFSLLLGGIHANPDFNGGKHNIDSDLTKAPFFLVGGAYRVQKVLVVGLGVYPIASAGATFHYPGNVGGTFKDTTELFFLEASPGIAVNALPNLRFGLGYRITYVRLNREQTESGQPSFLDFTVTGQNFTGFRLGAQYDALPWLHFGAVFRNKVTTKVTNSHGIALGYDYSDVATHFTLPSKFGAGARVDFDVFRLPLGLAADLEYTVNSENKGDPLVGTPPATSPDAPGSVANVFNWTDSQTLRLGAEYRILHDATERLDRVPLRVGYVYDTKTANATYPTAFGTPPGPTHIFTLGTGYNGGTWQTNVAYAYRFGRGAVSKPDTNNCAFCSYAGNDDYSIHLSGIYLDASYKF